MIIKIFNDRVEIDGEIYRNTSQTEMWGMKEIANYLGNMHSDGTPNVNNLYKDKESVFIKFPNFERDKALKGRKPWTKDEVIRWLSIPKNERLRMYREMHANNA